MANRKFLPVLFWSLSWGGLPYSTESDTLVAAPESLSLRLPDKTIRRGSVALFRNGVRLHPETDFRVDYEAKTLFLLQARNEPETLRIAFEVPSLEWPGAFSHRRREDFGESFDSARPPPSTPVLPPAEDTGAALSVGGSKTVGVTVGSGNNFSLDQSLDLSIQGKVAEGVALRAILTDQHLPFQPEGNTESIRELDRVLVEVESPRFKGLLGDFFLEEHGTRFSNFNRKIQGASGEAHGEAWRGGAAGAVAEGLFHTAEFKGEEGNQGPYALPGRDGGTGIVVVAGTERVFADGRLLSRGQNRDYVIEYGNGQITFTPHFLVTADLTFTVEYEYSEREFTRSIASAGGEAAGWEGKLKVSVRLFREGDDPDHPLRAPLSETDRASLSRSGDSAAAPGSGVFLLPRDSVNVNRGFYVYDLSASALDSHFVFHSPRDTALFRGRPWYRVEFAFLGPGPGRYIREVIADSTDPELSGTYSRELVIYAYRDSGGEYAPGRPLPLPGAHSLGTLTYQLTPAKGMTLKGEVTGSDRDPNVLSGRDNGDNRGEAFAHAFSWEGKKLNLSARHEYVSSTFAPLTPSDQMYPFLQKWNLALPGQGTSPGLQLAEGRVGATPSKALSAGLSGGLLSLHRAGARRGALDFTAEKGGVTLSGLEEAAQALGGDTTGRVLRTYQKLAYRWVSWTPSLSYTGEFKTTEEKSRLARQSRYGELSLGVNRSSGGVFSTENEAQYRWDRVGEPGDPGVTADSASAYTLKSAVSLNGAAGSVDGSVTHRRSRRRDNGWQRYGTDLVSVGASHNAFRGAVQERFRYGLSATRSRTTLNVYREVGAGLGNYKRDSLTGDYIPYPGGNFELAGASLDTASPGQEINASELSYRLTSNFSRAGFLEGHRGFLRDLSTETYLYAEQEKLSGPLKYLPDLLPNRVEGRNSTRYQLNVQQDVTLEPAGGRFSARLRFYPRFRYDFRRTSADPALFEKDRWRNYFLSLRTRFSLREFWTLQHEAAAEWIRREKDLYFLDYDIFNRRLENEVTYSPGSRWSFPLGATAGLSVNRNAFAPARAPYFLARPGAAFSLPSRGRAEASYEMVWVVSDAGALLYEMAQGNAPGRTRRWNFTVRMNLRENLLFDLLYAGERAEKDPRPVHRGSAQLKAYF